MKFLILLLLASFTGYTNADWFKETENIGFFQSFAVHLLSIPSHLNCLNATRENLKIEEDKAIECIKNIRYSSSFCYTFVNHFKPCVQGLLKETANCDNSHEIQVKNVVIDSFIEEARFICGTDGEHILEMMNPCVLVSIQKSDECRTNLTSPRNNFEDITHFCSLFPSLQKCFEDQMKNECVNEMTRTTIHDLFSVNVKPCNMVMQMFFELGRYL